MGQKGKGKQRNVNGGLTSMDNGGIECGNEGYGVGGSNRDKGWTNVSEQQETFKKEICKPKTHGV